MITDCIANLAQTKTSQKKLKEKEEKLRKQMPLKQENKTLPSSPKEFQKNPSDS